MMYNLLLTFQRSKLSLKGYHYTTFVKGYHYTTVVKGYHYTTVVS